MKPRVVPILITVVLSGALLFGGWFLYRQMTLQSPLHNMVTKYEGVNSAQMDITKDKIVLNLDIKPNTQLPGLVQQLKTEGKSLVGNRVLQFVVVDHSSNTLNEFWEKAMFSVAEAMENKRYTDIPKKLEELTQASGDVKVTTEMDDTNVYVNLISTTDAKASKFIILPRDPGKLGVWNNAKMD
ncbi:hypothetical protein [Paenibacillus sp. IHBB 10380]|uniref:hypothetical protein n=1 Tax=Paenibacillus sp. IHBB 10380 TaxID=1566358 RepID=UPI0005CF9826|nr:hypothetical protein [Paenibacillus sp. IHBB 10380]AJS58079.1 hypothetical protein UB51_05705 [Paenibacillus sp. IHBB 10380]